MVLTLRSQTSILQLLFLLAMPASRLCQLVSHFGPAWNISTTIRWIVMKLCTEGLQRINPADFSWSATMRVTFLVQSEISWLFNGLLLNLLQISKVPRAWIMYWYSDLSLAPPLGKTFHLISGISQHLQIGLASNFVQIFMVPGPCILMTLGIPLIEFF